MTKDSVHLLFLGLIVMTAVIMPVMVLFVALIWAIMTFFLDRVTNEPRD